jgi:succinate-semialdehyde dehydrogenase/glutarate-semialdehyde dehydrogenase
MSLTTVDPTTGRELARFESASDADVDRAVTRAAAAQAAWRRVDVRERSVPLLRLAVLLRDERETLAGLMASEMGKPLAQGRAEVDKCASASDHVAENAAAWLADELATTDASRSYVAFEPLGLVVAVMPWNFPAWQVVRAAVPALMAGNGVLLKHATNVTGCALALDKLFAQAGFPDGLFRALVATHDQVARLLAHESVQGLTLTGSTEAGRALAPMAAREIKKCVMELGGSDPYVVLVDADLDLAVESCVASRLVNGGQSCIAAKRFIVVEPVRERFTTAFVEAMRGKRMGPPTEAGVDLGPMARRDLRDALHDQVKRSVAAGARLLLGGEIPDGPGAFYPPSVLEGVMPGMPAFDEELFGPVAAIVAARDEEDAIALANRTSFGLGAAVFTKDVARGERIARARLMAGSCFVNGFVKSDPRLPFGGIKASGYGRELSVHGIREFTNVKSIWVR